MASRTLFVLALTAEVMGVKAMWPFAEREYTAEGMVDAGSLGIEGIGRVVAVGDWDGDQQ
jgi:integrin alpha FG-GAP repeat containing protein 1